MKRNSLIYRKEYTFLYFTIHFNPVAIRKAKIVHNFGLSECNVKSVSKMPCSVDKKIGKNIINRLIVPIGKYFSA